MNNQLQKFGRDALKKGLAQLPESFQMMFKRMYSHEDLTADINNVVDALPEDRIDWAMQQVQKTLDKQPNK